MSNYLMIDDKIAFHPGYYIKEYIDNHKLSQADFAYRLGTTPKNISYIIRGEQSISIDIAMKLARLLKTSEKYWLNLQSEYDSFIALHSSIEELKEEQKILDILTYEYFVKYYGLSASLSDKEERVKSVREFLNVSSLCAFKNKDMYVHFNSTTSNIDSLIKSNVMAQLAFNMSLEANDIPAFTKKKFDECLNRIIEFTSDEDIDYLGIKSVLFEYGIDFLMLDCLDGISKIGCTKKIGNHIMLMVSKDNDDAYSFFFTLFHELGHILLGDYGITDYDNNLEEDANDFAINMLIPIDMYKEFLEKSNLSDESIIEFANKTRRNANIIYGKLKADNIIY